MRRADRIQREMTCRSCGVSSTCPGAQRVADPDAECPLQPPAWNKISLVEAVRTKQYGDAVAKLAKPVARVVDFVIKTNLVGCPSCARRQANLNVEE